MIAAAPTGKIRAIWLFAIAALIVLAFLFTPKRDIGECVVTLHFAKAVQWPHNCDSTSIAANASNFERFLNEGNPWRARPVYVFVVGTMAHILSPLSILANPLMKSATLPNGNNQVLQRLDRTVKRFFPVYLAAILFNAGILALMIGAAISMLEPQRQSTAITIAAMLAASDLIAGWFWTTHPIIMNGLVPIGGPLAFLFGMTLRHQTPAQAVLCGLIQAIGCLTYGLALIWPVLTSLGLAYAWLLRREPLLPTVRNFALFALAVCLPMLLWFGMYRLRGQMIAYEAQTVGQFQWMGRALASGTLATEAWTQFVEMLAAWVVYFRWIGGLIIAGFVLAATYALRRGKERQVLSDPVIVAGLLTLFCIAVFTYLQGYHQPRLNVPMLTLVSLMTYRLLARAGREGLATLTLGITALVSFIAVWLGPAVTQT